MLVEKIKDLFLYFTIFVYFILAFTPKILGGLLLSAVMIAHPDVVGRIISLVETPLVIRIGLAIMTYPILLAGLWFGFKIFTYLDDEPDPKKETADRLAHDDDEKNGCAGYGCSFIFFLLPFLLLLIFGLAACDELQLRHQLLQEGVSGVATVQKCEKEKGSRGGTSCYMSYDYEVRLANNRTKLYRVRREHVSCARVCNVGSSVDITYLPQTPSEAGIEGNTYRLNRSVFWFTILFNIFSLPLAGFLYYLIDSALGWFSKL